jgi:aminopeptidase
MPTWKLAVDKAQAMVTALGSSNTKALSNVDPGRLKLFMQGRAGLNERLMERMGSGEMHWVGTQCPAESAAQDAEMSFGEYEDFVYSACLVDQEDPVGAWRSVEKEQERVCNLLGDKKELHIVSEGTDLTMRVEGRK